MMTSSTVLVQLMVVNRWSPVTPPRPMPRLADGGLGLGRHESSWPFVLTMCRNAYAYRFRVAPRCRSKRGKSVVNANLSWRPGFLNRFDPGVFFGFFRFFVFWVFFRFFFVFFRFFFQKPNSVLANTRDA